MTNREFVLSLFPNWDGVGTIMYKPYEYGMRVIDISLGDAIEIIEKDVKELENLDLLTHEQCVEGARKIFRDHLFIPTPKKKRRRR